MAKHLDLNRSIEKFQTTGYPLVISKIAMTLDGKITTRARSSRWINNAESRELSHHWRSEFDAILTGSSTILSDDSSLNCRIPGGKDPIRVVIDSQLRTSPQAKIYTLNSQATAILATSNTHNANELKPYEKNNNVTIYQSALTDDGKVQLPGLLKYLATEHKIMTVMLEAGPALNGVMLKQGLIDEFYVFVAPKIIGDSKAYSPVDGIETININDAIHLHDVAITQIGDDVLIKSRVKDQYKFLK